MLVGFSPRQQNPTIYNMGGIEPDEQPFKKLGKYTTGKGCLYIKRLDDVDPPTLKRQIEASFTRTKERSAEHAAE